MMFLCVHSASPPKWLLDDVTDVTVTSWQCNLLTSWCKLLTLYPCYLHSNIYPIYFRCRFINPQIHNSLVGAEAKCNAKICNIMAWHCNAKMCNIMAWHWRDHNIRIQKVEVKRSHWVCQSQKAVLFGNSLQSNCHMRACLLTLTIAPTISLAWRFCSNVITCSNFQVSVNSVKSVPLNWQHQTRLHHLFYTMFCKQFL